MLKSQDILLLLKLCSSIGQRERSFLALAASLGISASEAHAAAKRAAKSGLLDGERNVRKNAFIEFLVHGLRYVFPPEWIGVTRGIATSYAAAPLSAHFAVNELPPVWPHPEGTIRGEGLIPLFRSVPDAALRDAQLYELLALVDAVRSGNARERTMAAKELQRRISE